MRSVVLALALVASALLLGCGREPCSGPGCRCPSGDCAFACEGRGCDFTCGAGASCDHACPEGGCQMQCDGATRCLLECAGDGCQVQCSSGVEECVITGCARDCQLQCGGAAVCESSCTGEGCQTQP